MAKFEGSTKISKKEGDTSINVLGKKTYHGARMELIENLKRICCNCGKFMDKSFVATCSQPDIYNFLRPKFAHRVHGSSQGINVLCEDCAKKCKKCGKYYCPTHLKTHKCI